jgi:hypothetical protein
MAAENDAQPWWFKFEIAAKLKLYGEGNDTGSIDLSDQFPGKILDKYLWIRRASYALFDDLRSDSLQTNVFHKVNSVLNAFRPRVLGHPPWEVFSRFRLVFVEGDGTERELAVIQRSEK